MDGGRAGEFVCARACMYICMHVQIQMGEVNMSGLRLVKARDETLVSFSRNRALTLHLLTDRISPSRDTGLTDSASWTAY